MKEGRQQTVSRWQAFFHYLFVLAKDKTADRNIFYCITMSAAKKEILHRCQPVIFVFAAVHLLCCTDTYPNGPE